MPGISRLLAYELVRRGALPHVWLARRIVISRRAVERMGRWRRPAARRRLTRATSASACPRSERATPERGTGALPTVRDEPAGPLRGRRRVIEVDQARRLRRRRRLSRAPSTSTPRSGDDPRDPRLETRRAGGGTGHEDPDGYPWSTGLLTEDGDAGYRRQLASDAKCGRAATARTLSPTGVTRPAALDRGGYLCAGAHDTQRYVEDDWRRAGGSRSTTVVATRQRVLQAAL